MKTTLQISAFLILFAIPPTQLSAAEEIKVPFNFRWGDAKKLVEDTIVKTQARIAERKTTGGREVVVVEGHPDPRLKRSLFYFDNGALGEIELQYSDSSWDTAKMNGIFEQTRRNLDRKYGTSRNIARRRGKDKEVMQTVVGYQWTQDYTSLRLFLFSAEQGADTFRILSYHYRGF